MTSPLLFRTATFTQLTSMQANLRKISESLLRRETEIATGSRFQNPSDSPLSFMRAMNIKRQIDMGEQFARNITLAKPELESEEQAISDLSNVVERAREIYIEQSNSPADAINGDNAAQEVQLILEEAVEIANRQFRDRYIFGGRSGGTPPAAFVGDFVKFTGSPEAGLVNVAQGMAVEREIPGAHVFQSLSTEIKGRTALNPVLDASTKLADLNFGAGIRTGSIIIQDGLGQEANVNLSNAETVGDILNLISGAGLVSASLTATQDGIELSAPGGNITVTEANGGEAAGDLGILQATVGGTLSGVPLDPVTRLTTPLSELNDGAGVDLSGVVITNGGSSMTVDFTGASTVQDILNRISGAGVHVNAKIGGDANSIDLKSALSGAHFTVEENGGTSAADLGLMVGFEEMPFDSLNNGLGVQVSAGSDFLVTAKDGSIFEVDVSNANKVQDVLDLINNHPANAGLVLASIVGGQDSIQIADLTSGTGELSVSTLNGSFAAANLGLDSSVPDPATVLVGGDLQTAGFQPYSVFTTLIQLRDGIKTGNDGLVRMAGKSLEEHVDHAAELRGEIGSRINVLELAEIRHADNKFQFEVLVSNEMDVDIAESVVEFEKQRNIFEASLAVSSRILSLSLLDFLG